MVVLFLLGCVSWLLAALDIILAMQHEGRFYWFLAFLLILLGMGFMNECDQHRNR